VGRSCNGWSCEHEWRQDQSVMTKWVPVMSPYRWTSTSSSKGSFEERFLAHQPRASGISSTLLSVATSTDICSSPFAFLDSRISKV
jgi:hypothetical protein